MFFGSELIVKSDVAQTVENSILRKGLRSNKDASDNTIADISTLLI